MVKKEERFGQIKYMDKREGQLPMDTEKMVDHVEAAVETAEEVAAGPAASVVAGAGDFKAPVVRDGEIILPDHARRM